MMGQAQNSGLRLSRKPEITLGASPVFFVPSGIAERWLYNLKNPSFCTMVLCNGSCTDPFLSRAEANENFVHATVGSSFHLSTSGSVAASAMGEQCRPDLGCRLHGLFD
jgi:hypothetical protein